MCDSIAEGGKRCAAHTRPGFQKVMAALDATHRMSRNKVRLGKIDGDLMNTQAVIHYASTPAGAKDVQAAIDKFQTERDMPTVMWLKNALVEGGKKAEVDLAVRAEIKVQAVKAKRAETKSSSNLSRSRNKDTSGRLAVAYAEAATMWHPTKNTDHRTGDILTAEEVDGGSNAQVWWICPEGHEFQTRCNNTTQQIRRGSPLRCPDCTGRRQRSLENMQEDLAAFVTAVDGDPEAWESLSQAAKYAILHNNGMLSGSTESFQRATAMGMINGSLTLSDVVDAKEVKAIDRAIALEGMGEDDENAKVIDISEDSPVFDTVRFATDDQDARIDQVMASAGAIGLVGSNEMLVSQIMREQSGKLWNEVHADETKADQVLARIKAGADKNPFRARLAAQFEQELATVRSTPLPEGYNNTKTLPNGMQIEINPTLAQRRFALNVDQNRVHGNWSGTGAGKTLAGVLSVAQTGAQESLVICPAGNVVLQWKDEFERAYPGTEVRTELPELGEDLDATRDGRRRVWVLNYDKFSTNTKEVAEKMGPLADRLEATVLDEVHKAKSTDPKAESARRRTLEGVLDRAREANPDLAVMPTTATPVVTSLEEAKSILRLAYGKDSPAVGMGTAPTLKNAAFAYQALSAAGTRVMPNYKPTLTRTESRIDITDNVPVVLARMDAIAEKHVTRKQAEYNALPELEKRRRKPFDAEAVRKRALSHPSTMERALLPERLPKIVEKVRAANGPVVVYSEYTTDMVNPIVERLRSEGITAAQYTGSESTSERAELIRKFQQGEIHVLVGSKSIGTGVDGLQRVSKNSIVASMSWTAAEDDQFVGRLHRTGQTENVTVDYLLTEVDLGEGNKWSYCRGRLNRIQFRRSLADAAVDGKMPDGQLSSENAQVAKAVEKMRALVTSKSDFAQAA